MIRHMYENGVSITEIRRNTGLDRKTIRKYVQDPGFKTIKKRMPKVSKLEPYKDHIRSRLQKYDLSAVRILEEIQERGYDGRYSIVKDFVREVKKSKAIIAEYRFETEPGVQAQVDWAEMGTMMIDGVERKIYCFTMILGYSRMRYVEFTLDTKTETFVLCHIHAFIYYGGITREILYDNTKNVVLHRALKSTDSTWNPLFEDFFRYYGFFPRLCKPGKAGAKTKGKVERLVQYVKDNFYLGRLFESFQDLNNQGLAWMKKVNSLVHGTTKKPPIELFPEEKLAAFDTKTPFQISRIEYRKITKECFFSYLGNLYSAPWQYANMMAELRIQNDKIIVMVNGLNICQHVQRDGTGHRIRVKEHFEGLLKAIRSKNKSEHILRISNLLQKAPVVEHRPLAEYDVFLGGALVDGQ